MAQDKREEYVAYVTRTFDELSRLFQEKNTQYGNEDPLANFRTGAFMSCHAGGYPEMYEEAKGYVRKHIAHIMNNGIAASKGDESLKDIAVYSIIMLYLRDRYESLNGESPDPETR